MGGTPKGEGGRAWEELEIRGLNEPKENPEEERKRREDKADYLDASRERHSLAVQKPHLYVPQ